MIFFGVMIGLAIIAVMVYLALDKKSNFATRMASLGALAVMILTIIICFVIVLTDNRVPIDESILIVGAPPEIDESGGNLGGLFLLIIFLFALFGLIAFLTLREHKKGKTKKEASPNVFKKFEF